MSSSSSALTLAPLILSVLFLPGCNALNPLCGSSRPKPVLTAITPTTVTYAQVQQTFQLTVTGSHFVASSVILVNGKEVTTSVPSSTTLVGTVGPAAISGTGSSPVSVHTPSGNSGDLGCTSGGNSDTINLTVN
jgi:hypothetical protein